jgi:hypothetical protein
MPQYKAGDVVVINGIQMTLGSWPENDEGPFTAHYQLNDAKVYGTYWTGQVQSAPEVENASDTVAGGGPGQPVQTSAQVQIVASGDGVESTASLSPDVIAQVEAEIEKLEAEVKAKADTEPAQ